MQQPEIGPAGNGTAQYTYDASGNLLSKDLTGSDDFSLRYRYDGANRLNTLRTTIPYVSSVTNLVPSTGGVDAENAENAKARGPMSIRSGARAVPPIQHLQHLDRAGPGRRRLCP